MAEEVTTIEGIDGEPISTQIETTEEVVEDEGVALPSDSSVIPEKFKGKSAEEIAAAYTELEKKLGERSDSITEHNPEGEQVTTPEEGGAEEGETPPPVVTPEEYKTYEQEFLTQGDLSEETYAELAKRGITKEMVQEEVAWRQFQEERALSQVLSPIDKTKEDFQEVVAWAQQNKTPEEIEAFNTALSSSPVTGQQLLLKGLFAEYESSTVVDSSSITTRAKAPRVAGSGYTSEVDFKKDIQDRRYGRDRAYTKAVEKKLSESDTTGWAVG